jgi:uncharacterized protein (TIGR02996 family)
MNQDTAFIEAIRANPCDDFRRLVYADWLEERGDPRAEYIRLVAELAALVEKKRSPVRLRARLRQLTATISQEWRESVGKRFDVFLLSFRPEKKIRTIAAVRRVTGLGLKDAVDLVEGVPALVKGFLLREEAETLREDLETGYMPNFLLGERLPEGEWCCVAAIRDWKNPPNS